MKFHHLRYLVSLNETGSFSKTAEEFYTSQQVISNAIKQLETELNVKILQRSNRGVRFTRIGIYVLDYANDIIERTNTLLDTINDYQSQKLSGTLNVYIAPRFSNDFFLSFYKEYQRANKNLTLCLRISSINFMLNNSLKDSICILPVYEQKFLCKEFQKLLASQELHYEIFAKQSLGYCIHENNPFKQDVINCVAGYSHREFPVVTFNCFANEEMFFLKPVNRYTLLDNIEVQQKMMKAENYIGIYTLFEYTHIINRNSNIQFVTDESLESLYFLALFHNSEIKNENITNFIENIKKVYAE